MSGRAIVEGETLGPWDVLLGPGEVPHGPILFPEDCLMLVNAVGDRRPR